MHMALIFALPRISDLILLLVELKMGERKEISKGSSAIIDYCLFKIGNA